MPLKNARLLQGTRATDLAELAQMTKQSMGDLIRYLEQCGYIERVPDPNDHRARIVRRTDRGWEIEYAACESIARVQDRWANQIGEKRMREFRAVLEDLVATIES